MPTAPRPARPTTRPTYLSLLLPPPGDAVSSSSGCLAEGSLIGGLIGSLSGSLVGSLTGSLVGSLTGLLAGFGGAQTSSSSTFLLPSWICSALALDVANVALVPSGSFSRYRQK